MLQNEETYAPGKVRELKPSEALRIGISLRREAMSKWDWWESDENGGGSCVLAAMYEGYTGQSHQGETTIMKYLSAKFSKQFVHDVWNFYHVIGTTREDVAEWLEANSL
jgi:hypothetical protein